MSTAYYAGLARRYCDEFDGDDAADFERGLAESMKQQPVESPEFDIKISFDTLTKLALGEKVVLYACSNCKAIGDTVGKCRSCGSDQEPIDANWLDQNYPWSHCGRCNFGIAWDYGIGGNEPGTYMCPKCYKAV